MQNFVFQNPTKILFGKGEIQKLGFEIDKKGIKKALILAGGGSIKNNGVYDQVINSLDVNGINSVEKWGVQANPTLSHLREAIELAKEEKVEAVVAVGGGSVIDEAKALAAGYYLDDIWQAYEQKEKVNRALPIFVVLTLSATGSEMNPHSVLTNEQEKKKWPISAPCLYPTVSIIDPSVQYSLPWNQTVNGGVDAISHVLEHYISSTNQEITMSIDEGIIKTVIKSVDILKDNPKNYSARANLAWAATIALNGISGLGIIGDWSTHRIEHGVSAVHPRVAHGEGLAILFPALIKYLYKDNEDTFLRLFKNIWDADSINEGLEKMKDTYKSWGAPITFNEIDIKESDLEEIAQNALMGKEFGYLRKLNKEDVLNILRLAL